MPYFLIIEKRGVVLIATTTAYQTQTGIIGCYQSAPTYRKEPGNSTISRCFWDIMVCIKDCVLIDPCCGSGHMFVQSAKFVKAHSGTRGELSVYDQESNADTWKMGKMNMAIRGIEANFGPYQADTFFNDLQSYFKGGFYHG